MFLVNITNTNFYQLYNVVADGLKQKTRKSVYFYLLDHQSITILNVFLDKLKRWPYLHTPTMRHGISFNSGISVLGMKIGSD